MTLAQLKRDLQVGKTLTMTYNSIQSGNYLERLNKPRKIVKIQSNGIYLEVENTGKGSFLELPKATLMDYNGKNLTIYETGYRDLTAEEKRIKDNEPSKRLENRQLLENDSMTDGSQMYWADKRYYKELKAEHLEGFKEVRGLYFDFNRQKIRDNSIKGEISLKYTIN